VIAALVVAVFVLIALAYVAAPLRRGPRPERTEPDHLIEEAHAKKRVALGAIIDLEQEVAIGKLSAADFEVLRVEYEGQALTALKELDVIRQASEGDDVESEIAAMRQRLRCPSCGAPRTPEEACPRCGR
jgi:hypothetical protein